MQGRIDAVREVHMNSEVDGRVCASACLAEPP